MVTVVQGKVCAKNHPDRLSRLATIHQRYRRTDGRTDFLWHRPDLTVGQKLALERTRMHHFQAKLKNFLGGHTPSPLGRGIPPPQTLPTSATSAPRSFGTLVPQILYLAPPMTLQLQRSGLIKTVKKKVNSFQNCLSQQLH